MLPWHSAVSFRNAVHLHLYLQKKITTIKINHTIDLVDKYNRTTLGMISPRFSFLFDGWRIRKVDRTKKPRAKMNEVVSYAIVSSETTKFSGSTSSINRNVGLIIDSWKYVFFLHITFFYFPHFFLNHKMNKT